MFLTCSTNMHLSATTFKTRICEVNNIDYVCVNFQGWNANTELPGTTICPTATLGWLQNAHDVRLQLWNEHDYSLVQKWQPWLKRRTAHRVIKSSVVWSPPPPGRMSTCLWTRCWTKRPWCIHQGRVCARTPSHTVKTTVCEYGLY